MAATSGPRTIRRAYYAVDKAPSKPHMSPDERARLVAFYRPYNQRLAEQLASLGLSLPDSWASPSRGGADHRREGRRPYRR